MTEIMFHIQVNVVLSFLLALLLGHAYFKMNWHIKTNKLFMWIMFLIFLVLILEIMSVVLNNPHFIYLMIIQKVVDVAGFLLAPITPFLGYLFCKEWINRYRQEKIISNKLLVVPAIFNGILALLSYHWHILFYITPENIYERGPLFFILPSVSYIYFIYTLYFIYRHHTKYTRSEIIIFSAFFIVPAVFTLMQLKYPVYLTTWSSAALITVVTYIFILNDQVYTDSLTGLGNRLFYEHCAQKIDRTMLSRLAVIYVDLDNLKLINDQYGHNEGDEAIKAFAGLLVDSFPARGKRLIRLGGDEFLIILEERRQAELDFYMKNLIQHIVSHNEKSDKQYKIMFSYGIAKVTDDCENMQQLLERADHLMYQQKQQRKLHL